MTALGTIKNNQRTFDTMTYRDLDRMLLDLNMQTLRQYVERGKWGAEELAAFEVELIGYSLKEQRDMADSKVSEINAAIIAAWKASKPTR